MGHLLLRLFGRKPCRLYFVSGVFINIDCNKRGQPTSCLVARAQIQTDCNLEKNMYKCIWVLDFVYSGFI